MMVLKWRRAFCTSVPPEPDSAIVASSIEELQYEVVTDSSSSNPKFCSRFGFFSSSSNSNPSTPRLRSHSGSSPSLICRTTTATVPESSSSLPASPKLQCETKNSPRYLPRSSNPSSPRSPSPLSFLKSSLRLHTRKCGLCFQSLKNGQGMATFTAECYHNFHFQCISDHIKQEGSLACPVCSCLWKEMPLLSVDDQNQMHHLVEEEEKIREKLAMRFIDDPVGKGEPSKQQPVRPELMVYNDDEPLACLTPIARFIPIPESDENCDEDSVGEFQGFYVDGGNNSPPDDHARDVEVQLLPEVAVMDASRRHETYAIVLKVKGPVSSENAQRRAPIDVVTVVDVSGKMTSEKLHMIKKAMRLIVSTLSSSDRLSIVAFSSYSKRLLPLRRMTTSGRRAARRIVQAMGVLGGSSNSKDAVKKAVKVLEDRREKNPVAMIILLSEVLDHSSSISSTRHPHSRSDVPIHSLTLSVTDDHDFAKCIRNLLSVTVQDLRLELGFVSESAPAVIVSVYSRTPQPIGLGSGTVVIGDLSREEERELLVELKVSLSTVWSQQVLSVRCCYRDSSSQQIIYGKQQALPLPRPNTVRSSSAAIQRLRTLFITTRALAESRRLTERNDPIGAYHVLISARALMQQSNTGPDNEFTLGLEAELRELQRLRKVQSHGRRCRVDVPPCTEEKDEPLTPTSAWRVADKLAKVAMMRKSVNRVSDLHGFEDARF